MAGQAAAEARARAAGAPGYYNIRAGDWRLRLESAMGLDFDDNVRLTEDDPESDIILRPSLRLLSTLPVSQKNSLTFGIGGGYSYYCSNKDLSRFFLTPDTGLSFDIYVQDWIINLHDRFTVTQEAYQNAATTGNGDFSYMENTAGVEGVWDLNRLRVTLGYDNVMRKSLNSSNEQLDGSQNLFTVSGALVMDNLTSIGLQGTLGLIQYDQDTLQGGVQYSGGAFYQRQIGRFFSVQAGAGYFVYVLDDEPTGSTSTVADTSNIDGLYANLSVNHRLNQVIQYSLEAGHEFQAGLYSDSLDLYYVRLQANWNLVRKLPISTRFSYEDGTQTNFQDGSSGSQDEKIQRVGGGISVSRLITEKLSTTLGYEVYSRNSDLPNRGYLQNRVSLTASYRF
jgi:hypothetical protein